MLNRCFSVREKRPRLYLHIGRNKAGSTTLQNFFLTNRDQLMAAGLGHYPFGHLRALAPGVPGFASHYELIEHARSRPGAAYLISNEIMCGWQPDIVQRFIDDLTAFDIRIIVYLRSYGSWVRSSYAHEVRRGQTQEDFDAFLERYWPHVSIWPKLEGWAAAVGWARLRIRSLHSQDLIGGDLIADVLSALDLDLAFDRHVPHSNRAPHWAAIEMVRALDGLREWTGWSAAQQRGIVEPLMALMTDCLTRQPVPDASYLTADQALSLANLYNRDARFIAERTGIALQPEAPPRSGRTTLPEFDRIPRALLLDWAQRAASPAFRAAHPEAAEAAIALAGKHRNIFVS